MGRVLQPCRCVVCGMPNNRFHPMSTHMRNLEDLDSNNYQCGFCHSIFKWNPATREACGLETRYPLTRAGWDEDIRQIDPKYLKGDVCPNCKGDKNYKETFFMGNQGRCIICNGTGVYPGDDA